MQDKTTKHKDQKLKSIRAALQRKEARDNLNKPVETQLMQWVNAGPKWSIALTLHTPLKLRYDHQGHDELWLEQQVSVLFNILSKVIFADIPKKKRPMLRRLITLEKDIYVGWHAHGVISTPAHIDDEILIDAIKAIWTCLMAPHARPEFKDRLAWCEPINGNYQQYCVKAALSAQSRNPAGQFGTISLRNTHL